MTTGKDITTHDPDSVPWLERDWRLIRKYRTNYPSKQVFDVQPNEEHPLGQWHYEDDTTQTPHIEELTPLFLEKNADGSYTTWQGSLYGPIGQSGTLTPEAEAKLEKVTRRKDRRQLEAFIKTLERSDRIGQTLAESMLTAKHGKPVDLSKDNGRNKA